MSRRSTLVVVIALFLVVMAGLPALAGARGAYTATAPKLSATPVVGVPFKVSGNVRPKATVASRTSVRVTLSTRANGRWAAVGTYRAKLAPASAGTAYFLWLTVPHEGSYALRAFHYRAGKMVARSTRTAFEVAQRISIDSNVNGWIAPELGETPAPPDTPLDVVFTTPADWDSGVSEKLNGAAHFIWGDFEKVDADGLIWHTDGLSPGRYDWMRDAMPKWGTGVLVVAQHVDVDKVSHADVGMLPYLPADISFGGMSDSGMGCDRSIAFLTRVFTQESADPLVWHTAGLPPAIYDWKCWMDECHYGKLVVEDGADVAVDSDPLDSRTVVSAGTPLDLVFSGARMLCWRTIHFTTGGDLTKTVSYSDADPHVTWHTAGLAPGTHEWECWMGPQCHHGTIEVQ